MNIEVVTIGDELLLGFTIDTNAAHLARELAAAGIGIARRSTVGDEAEQIVDAIREALDRTGGVITTGGLGPTSDDLTKPAIAKLFGRGMYLDEEHVAWMRERWRRLFGRQMPESNVQQAMIPEGARKLTNNHGSAPGIWLEDERGRWVAMLPGVPREMRGMLADTLLPLLRERAGGDASTVIRSRTLRTTGVGESLIADRIGDAKARLGDLSLAYLPGWEGVDLRLTTRGLPADAADAELDRGAAILRERVGDAVYGEGPATDLASVVLDACRRAKRTIAVAESCTGGLLGARLTTIPGSSDVFVGGVIAYANAVKRELLGVSADALDSAGAVSEIVAKQMATGVRERTGATIGLAITGVAGPDGGTPEKPVGTVWIAADLGGDVTARRLQLIGDREEVRRRATQSILETVRRALARPD